MHKAECFYSLVTSEFYLTIDKAFLLNDIRLLLNDLIEFLDFAGHMNNIVYLEVRYIKTRLTL